MRTRVSGAADNRAQQVGDAIGKALCLDVMKTRIDDLLMVRVSTLVANGNIRRDAVTALIRFGDGDGVEYRVGVRVRSFPSDGFWAMFVCPRCAGGAQRLRLLDGKPACSKCARASGLRYRSESTSTEVRHLVTAPPRIARLNSDGPLRVHPRPGRMLDRRANLEFALRRSRIVARKHGVDRAKDQGL